MLMACRLFNYEFVAKTPELALRDELYQLQHLAAKYLSILTEDLHEYKVLCEDECQKQACSKQYMVSYDEHDVDSNKRLSYWNFWLKHCPIQLPSYFRIACEIALTAPSSARVERLFASLTHCFRDNQLNELEDYVWCTGMLRFNEERKQRYPESYCNY